MNRQRAALAVAVGVSLAAAGGTIILMGVQPALTGHAADPTEVVTLDAPAPPPRVAALMTRAGCDGAVIGTQLYSRETGRCALGAATVTIAVFDTDELRDQWINYGRQYGGTFVRGPRWAAGLDAPDQAGDLAQLLGGTLVVI